MASFGCLLVFDWLSLTVPHMTYSGLLDFLGLGEVNFKPGRGGKYGYSECQCFEGMYVRFGSRDEVWFEMTGQGCRAFETYSKLNWVQVFDKIKDDPDIHITRLDVAADDHDKLLPIAKLADDVRDGNFVSRFGYWEVTESTKGVTIYHGSPKSDILFRIYDKAAEQGKEEHWVRVEVQARDDRARQLLALMTETPYPGSAFAAVVGNYLRYVNPFLDSGRKRRDQRDRWPMRRYWKRFLAGVESISLWSSPGVDYNMGNLYQFVINQAGAATYTYLQAVGEKQFLEEIRKRYDMSQNTKYLRLMGLIENGELL